MFSILNGWRKSLSVLGQIFQNFTSAAELRASIRLFLCLKNCKWVWKPKKNSKPTQNWFCQLCHYEIYTKEEIWALMDWRVWCEMRMVCWLIIIKIIIKKTRHHGQAASASFIILAELFSEFWTLTLGSLTELYRLVVGLADFATACE
jgi:hypothetical protein